MSILNKVLKKKEDGRNKKEEEEKKRNEMNAGAEKVDNPKKGDTQKAGEDMEKVGNKNMHSLAYKLLVKPITTEKTAGLNKENKYIFEVANLANKIEIKKAIKEVYGVMPKDVNIISVKGKKVGVMRRIRGRRKDWKKAIITMKKGDSIQIYGSDNK